MGNKETSIDWLIRELDLDNNSYNMRRINQAKEMHLQEIIDAYHINPLETKWKNIGKQYYAELYGKGL
jgi:hypothetical protein